MTDNDLERANELQKEIRNLQDTIYHLDRSIEEYERNLQARGKNPILRFVNYFKNLRAEQEGKKEAGIFLFATDSVHGISIPVDCDLIKVINEYFKKKLSLTKTEFQNIGKDEGNEYGNNGTD